MVNRENYRNMFGLAAWVNCLVLRFRWDWSKIRDHEARFHWSPTVPIPFLGALTDTRSI